MTDDHLQRHAAALAARVEALAEALRASGVCEEASAQLLSHASAAVMQALNLEALRPSALPPAAGQDPAHASYCLVFDGPEEPVRTLAAA
jgi:hypothetical protein